MVSGCLLFRETNNNQLPTTNYQLPTIPIPLVTL